MSTAASIAPIPRQILVNALVDRSAGHAAEMLPKLTVCGLCAFMVAQTILPCLKVAARAHGHATARARDTPPVLDMRFLRHSASDLP